MLLLLPLTLVVELDQYSSVIIVTTNSKPPTFPPTVTTITITKAATTTATPTLGNVTCDQTWVQIHCIVLYLNTITNAIKFSSTNTIAITLVRTVIKYKYFHSI